MSRAARPHHRLGTALVHPVTPARSPFSLFILSLVLVLLGPSAVAGEATERLEAFYREVRSLQADFEQRVLGPEGAVQERSQGEVWIKRPDRFRWDYRKPHQQLIVADGETVKFFDPELEQVTVRDFTAGLGHTPSQVLAGGGDLERHFHVREGESQGPLAWVVLEPREPGEAGFRKARIGVAESPARVRRFEFTDAFGNRTRIDFSRIELNPTLDNDRFQFQAPAGTDVLRGGGPNP